MPVNERSVEEIARAAGRESAREVLLLLGIDATTPEGIRQAQRNFAFLDDLRTGTDAVKRRVALTVVGAVVTAALAYLALGLRQ